MAKTYLKLGLGALLVGPLAVASCSTSSDNSGGSGTGADASVEAAGGADGSSVDGGTSRDGGADTSVADASDAETADAKLADAAFDTETSAPLVPVGVIPPYVVAVWAQGTTTYFNPDSIDSDGTHIWVGYQNKTTKDGSDGGPGFGPTSSIVEYTLDGKTVLTTIPVAGHVDGVRVDPVAKDIWVTTNEDGNAHLFKIDHATVTSTEYTLPNPLPHGGGLDDLGFVGGKMFIAASAPASDPNTAAALYSVTVSGQTATLTLALAGNASATDVASDAGVTLNLLDPDSITINGGRIVLASQGDSRLVFVTNPGSAGQLVSTLTVATQLDDTVWATAANGQLLVVDGKANTIYSMRKTGGFTANDVYTQTPDDSTIPNIVGTLDLATGNVAPIAVGFKKATGLLFLAD